MSKNELKEFVADVVCPGCQYEFGVYALLCQDEEDYPLVCPECRQDFNLGLLWTPDGVEATVQKKKRRVLDNPRLRKAFNAGRPSGRVTVKWFIRNFSFWFAFGFIFFPFVLLLSLFSGWHIGLLALLVYWVIGIILSAVLAEVSYDYYRFRFKDDGVTLERGIFMRNSDSLPYMKVQEISTRQGMVDSMLGLTNIYISTAASMTLPTPYGGPTGTMIEGVKDPKPLVDFLMERANLPMRTEVVNKVTTAEENSEAILEELIKIRETAEARTGKKRASVSVDTSV